MRIVPLLLIPIIGYGLFAWGAARVERRIADNHTRMAELVHDLLHQDSILPFMERDDQRTAERLMNEFFREIPGTRQRPPKELE